MPSWCPGLYISTCAGLGWLLLAVSQFCFSSPLNQFSAALRHQHLTKTRGWELGASSHNARINLTRDGGTGVSDAIQLSRKWMIFIFEPISNHFVASNITNKCIWSLDWLTACSCAWKQSRPWQLQGGLAGGGEGRAEEFRVH